jgi:hypothetical protein
MAAAVLRGRHAAWAVTGVLLLAAGIDMIALGQKALWNDEACLCG